MGQQREGDVAIPGRPRAHLIVVEPHSTLGIRKAGLDRPAHPGDADHRRHWHVRWPEDAVVGMLRRIAERAPCQQPVGCPWGALVRHLDAGPVVQPLALAPRARRQWCPRRRRQCRNEVVGPLLRTALPERMVRGNGEHIGVVLRHQPAAERAIVPVDLIPTHPGCGHPGGKGPCQHLPRQLRLGREAHLGRYSRLATARGILHPFLGQIQLPIQERPPLVAGYPTNTPIWQFSMRPAVPLYWRCTPTDLVPFFRNPVSSTINTPAAWPRCSVTYERRSSRTASTSQSAAFSSRCTPCGPGSPKCSANCQPFFRSTRSSSPARYRFARPRASARRKRCAIRACSPSNPVGQLAISALVVMVVLRRSVEGDPVYQLTVAVVLVRVAKPSRHRRVSRGRTSRHHPARCGASRF